MIPFPASPPRPNAAPFKKYALHACLLLALLQPACSTIHSAPPLAKSDRLLIVDPAKLPGHPLDLLDSLVLNNPTSVQNLHHSRYQLLIIHTSCPTCRDVVASLKARPSSADPVLILNLAPDSSEFPGILNGLATLHVLPGITVSSPVPLLLDINNNIVTAAKEDFP